MEVALLGVWSALAASTLSLAVLAALVLAAVYRCHSHCTVANGALGADATPEVGFSVKAVGETVGAIVGKADLAEICVLLLAKLSARQEGRNAVEVCFSTLMHKRALGKQFSTAIWLQTAMHLDRKLS